MSLLKTNEIQNYNGSSLTLTASTVSTSAQLNTGGNISVTGSLNVSDDSTTRTNLGLGTMATQNANAVAITGGTINTVQPATGQSLTIKDEDGNTAITIGTDNTAAGYLSLNFGSYHGGSGGAGSGSLSANTLSDYEHGTFTPTLTPESGSIALNAVSDVLTYTKIGGVVHIQGGLNNLTPSSATGNITLSNLPFPSANRADNSGRAGPIFYFSAMNGSGNHNAVVDTNVVAPGFLGENVAQVIISCKAEYLKTDNSSDLYVCFSYQTDS